LNKNPLEISNCKFTFKCPKLWEELYETNIDSVRFCNACKRDVYLSNSVSEAYEHASEGKCVAIPIELTAESQLDIEGGEIVVGMMGPPLQKKENIEDLYLRSIDRFADFYGIDGCPAGWFFVSFDHQGQYQFGVLERFCDIGLFAKHAKLILVDIPIGLVSSGNTGRMCDIAARKAIKPRGSSVFPAPARAALREHSYHKGSEANFLATGKKLSAQTWGIVPKIREVDDYLRSQNFQGKVREMHPELAFWALNGRKPLQFGKKKAEGAEERLDILTRFFPLARQCYEEAIDTYKRKDVARDDILDAMVGAVTARHFPKIETLPESPPRDEKGLAMEIVYALP